MGNEQILTLPINDLQLSENFYLRSKLMGFSNLAEIIRTPADVIVGKDDFTYDWLGELAKFLGAKGMLHLLQTLPAGHSRSN